MTSLSFLSTFFGWQGRITRSEWLTRLVVMALLCVAFGNLGAHFLGDPGAGIFALIYLLCAVTQSARRLHDVARSGWSQLMLLIPVFGPVWLLIQLFKRGVAHENRFGQDPASRSDYFKVDIAR
jgi:uncharacterized membrane protein YhaH (DUF805 family)